MELSPRSYRHEIGFSEGDKPTPEELEEMTDKLERRNAVAQPAEPAGGDEDISTDTANASEPLDIEPDTSADDVAPSAIENEREGRSNGWTIRGLPLGRAWGALQRLRGARHSRPSPGRRPVRRARVRPGGHRRGARLGHAGGRDPRRRAGRVPCVHPPV